MHENRETSETPAAQPGSRSAVEGNSHTARMHVPEESGRGIVPMNRSNHDGRLVGGEWGGNAADQGELSSIEHVPDTERVCACPKDGRECGQRGMLGRYSSAIRAACANEARADPCGLCLEKIGRA